MKINKLIKTFDDSNNFNNAIIPLSLDINEIIFIYHHSIDENDKNIVLNIIKKYKQDIKVSFLKTDEETLKEIVTSDTVVDVSVSKYLSLVLTEIAYQNNLRIIYFDVEEKRIKEYRDHTILCEQLFKLSIEDIIILGNGKILDHLHKPTTNQGTKEKIYEIIEKDKKFSKLIDFMSKTSKHLNKNDDGSITYNKEFNKLLNTDYYNKYFKNYNLFKINDNKIIFLNDDIKRMFFTPGELLEEYIYNKLLDSNKFDEVSMSVKIEFNKKENKSPVTCELDGLVLKDNTLFFVSAKSNKVDTAALNEIKVHNIHFGNIYSKSVVCVNTDLNIEAGGTYLKAMELGIYIVDAPYFKEDKLVEKFLSIFNGSYVYDLV